MPGASNSYMIHITSGRIHPGFVAELASETASLLSNNNRTQEQAVAAKVTLQRCLKRSVDEYELGKSGAATDLISQAFTALQTYRTSVALHISSGTWTDWDLDHDTILLDWDGYDGHEPISDNCPKTTIQPCLEAIRRSKLQFTKLDLEIDEESSEATEREFNLDDFDEEEMEVFSALKSAKFEADWPLHDSCLQSVSKIISCAKDLKAVQISNFVDFGDPEEGEHVATSLEEFEAGDHALKSIVSDHITDLTIESLPISKESIFELLNKYRDTLRTLIINGCAMKNDSWIDIIEWIKENLQSLSLLEITDLYEARQQANTGPYLTYEIAVCGTPGAQIGMAKIQAALQTILDDPLFEPHSAAYDELFV
ncbi:hypothetical protein E4T42_05998 [Aureobasidium subglaciale]|nr:hypothetical protein E4T42_05998 [Aureobasidium subglaciale]